MSSLLSHVSFAAAQTFFTSSLSYAQSQLGYLAPMDKRGGDSLKSLNEDLKSLSQAVEKNDATQIRQLTQSLERQIDALTKDGNIQFKSHPQPLTDLNNELANLQKNTFSRYDPSSLKTALTKALAFITIEISGHETWTEAYLTNPAKNMISSTAQKTSSFVVNSAQELAAGATHKIEEYLKDSDTEKRVPPFEKLLSDLSHCRIKKAELHEPTSEKTLMEDLKGIEAAYPELRGLAKYVTDNKEENGKLIDCIDRLIAAFLEKALGDAESPLTLALFNLLSLLPRLEASPSPKALMLYIEKAFETRTLYEIANHLKVESFDGGEELSQKIDIALEALSAYPLSEELSPVFKTIYEQVQEYIDRVATLSHSTDNNRIHNAQALARKQDYVGALKALKEVFDQGSLLNTVGNLDLSQKGAEKQISDVKGLNDKFKNYVKPEEKGLNLDAQNRLIHLEERKLAHNLSMFATFKVIAQRNGWDTQTAEEHFEKILKEVEKTPYDGSQEQNKIKREEIFNEKLKELSHPNNGLIDRFVHYIVFKLVKHFTNQFSQSIVQGAQQAFVNPLQNATKGHYGIMHAANNGILGLLFAERIWRRDDQGKLGVGEKESQLVEILQDMNNKGKKGEALVTEVVDKALEQFDVGTFSRIGIFNSIATFAFKKTAQLMITRMRLAESVFESISESIYSEKHPHYSIDTLLLKQMEELEKALGQEGEGGAMVIREGGNGKRIAQQLVENLFKLLHERKALTPERLEQKKEGVLAVLENATDDILKGVVVDLLLFGLEQLQQPETVNQTVLDVLKHANRALRPSQATLLRELFSDKPEDTSIEDLITLFEANYKHFKTSIEGVVTVEECKKAIQQKRQATEDALHKGMKNIINKAIGGIIETQLEAALKTPRQTLLQGVQWVHEQFTPYKAHLAGKKAYIEEMETFLSELNNPETNQERKNHLLQQIKIRHEKFLIQFQNQLNRIKTLGTTQPSVINRHINHFYQAIYRLQKPLKTLNDALITNPPTNGLNALKELNQAIRSIEGHLGGIEGALSYEELSSGGKAIEKGLSAAKQGGEIVKPLISTFLNNHVQQLGEQAVLTYKAGSTFTSIVQQGIFRPYLEYKSSSNTNPQETVAEDFSRTLSGWTVMNN